MILAILAEAALTFGGLPFGATEAEVRLKVGSEIVEERLADGNRALAVTETIAAHKAKRKWVIRENRFVEGVLVFSFKSEQSECQNLQQTALSSIEANYGLQPRLSRRSDSGPTGIQAELWVVTLAEGSRIEQRMIYVPLIRDCTVSGRYFAPAEGSSAF